MADQQRERDLLQDFAHIYIAFAHGTDAELVDDEVEIIAEKMREWDVDAERDRLVDAINRALNDYLNDDDSRDLRAAIMHVNAAAPTAVKQVIIDDLMGIALADDVFRHAESSFIKSLEDAWCLSSDGGAARNRHFSVIDQTEQYGGWTALHDLALLYLTLAHSTDGDLTSEESDAIQQKLTEWIPDAAESDVLRIVQGAMSVYAQRPDAKMMAESVAAVQRLIPDHQRQAVLSDLEAVAQADGNVSDRERSVIDQLRDAWQQGTA